MLSQDSKYNCTQRQIRLSNSSGVVTHLVNLAKHWAETLPGRWCKHVQQTVNSQKKSETADAGSSESGTAEAGETLDR